MQANRFDGCPSTPLSTLLICLHGGDNDFGKGDV